MDNINKQEIDLHKKKDEFFKSIRNKGRVEYFQSRIYTTSSNGTGDIDENKQAPGSYEPTRTSSNNHLVKLDQAGASKNGNWRSRCGCDRTGICTTSQHGTSYVAVDYNLGRGRGKYDIRAVINHYGRDYYENWEDFQFAFENSTYGLVRTGRLYGQGSPGREGYFSTGGNQTPGDHDGTLGVEVFDPGTNNRLYWALWDFNSGWQNWGDQWLHCGHDYGFWFSDN